VLLSNSFTLFWLSLQIHFGGFSIEATAYLFGMAIADEIKSRGIYLLTGMQSVGVCDAHRRRNWHELSREANGHQAGNFQRGDRSLCIPLPRSGQMNLAGPFKARICLRKRRPVASATVEHNLIGCQRGIF
jgi:hypothetical protein